MEGCDLQVNFSILTWKYSFALANILNLFPEDLLYERNYCTNGSCFSWALGFLNWFYL